MADLAAPGGPKAHGETSAPSAGETILNFQSGPRQGDTVSIGARTLSVGRSPDNDIVIDDPTVSRRHATITHDGGRYYIEDLQSTSGVKVNGRNIIKEPIPAGARVKLGNTEIAFGDVHHSSHQDQPQIHSASPAFNLGETRVIRKSGNLGWLAAEVR